MLKILYVHQYFATPESNAGTRSYEMAKRLIKNGHDVTFVTSSAFLSDNYKLTNGWNYIELDKIKLYVLHLPYSNSDSFFKRVVKFLNFSIRASIKSITIKTDVVFATSTPLTIAIPAVICSKLKKVPLVFEVRDLWPELPIAIGAITNPIIINFAKKLESFAYRNSTQLIGLSPGMCEGIERHGIAKDRITLATNSCDTDLFDVESNVGIEYRRLKLPFVGDRKLVVYTGTFGIINDVSYIVHLAKSSLELGCEVCFLAIGSGMEKQKVLTLAEKEGVLGKNLFILDPVPKTEVVKILSSADLSLSLFGGIKEMWHNSANKLFDGLASQTPVAINYGGWQSEIIDSSGCGLVLDSKDFLRSAEMINKFLFDSEAYQYAKNACRELAYNCYSRDIMAKRLESAIIRAVRDEKNI